MKVGEAFRYVLLLLLIVNKGICFAPVGTVTTRVLFGGGDDCESTCDDGHYYADSYACRFVYLFSWLLLLFIIVCCSLFVGALGTACVVFRGGECESICDCALWAFL